MMVKVLYFGSFNPVHYGHTGIAGYVASMPEVERVLIIPTPHSPFKELSILADPQKRLLQVRAAFDGISPKITVSDIEYHLSDPLYTINTLHVIQEQDPTAELVLLMGADNIGSIEQWHKGREILRDFRIWVYPRIGYDGETFCRRYGTKTGIKGVRFLKDAPEFDISSTAIRNASH